jgi:hypothetical protein
LPLLSLLKRPKPPFCAHFASLMARKAQKARSFLGGGEKLGRGVRAGRVTRAG